MILEIEVRDELLSRLGEEQRAYLSEVLVRGRRTVFANEMARQKGYAIPEGTDPAQIELLLDEWIYTGYIDAGKVTPDLRCECGRPLRYQHQVEHKGTGERKRFGIEHLKEHLAIDGPVVAAIKRGFDAIDYELDELLMKQASGWTIEPDLLLVDRMPDDAAAHIRLGLPLLDKQVQKLRQIRAAAIAASTPKPDSQRMKPAAQPVAAPATFDLFDWQEEEQEEPEMLFELPFALHGKVRAYLQGGIRSARVVCELLIEEYGASDRRFLTGKPRLYPGVCVFLESIDGVELESMSPEDRVYRMHAE